MELYRNKKTEYLFLGLLFLAVLVLLSINGIGIFDGYAFAEGLEAPTITVQPVGYDDEYSANLPSLSVEVSQPAATGFNYVWYAKPVGTTVFSAVGTEQNYPLNGVNDNGMYYCEISATDGTDTSSIVTTDIVAVNIYKIAISISIDNKESKYGEDLLPLTYTKTSGDFVNGDGYDDLNIVMQKQNGTVVGEYVISGSFSSENYYVYFSQGKYTIAPKDVYVDVANVSSEYGSAFKDLSYTLNASSSLATGDELSDLKISLEKAVGTNAGRYAINGTFDNDNYNVIFNEGIYNVIKRPLMVAFSAYQNLIYNGKRQTIECVIMGSPLEKDAVTAIVSYDKTPKDAGEITATARLSDNNYEIVGGNTKTFTIAKKPLEITLNNIITVDITRETFTFSYKGFAADETADYLKVKPTATYLSTAVGAYKIMPTGAQSDNYDISYKEGTVQINSIGKLPLAGGSGSIIGEFSPDTTASIISGGDTPKLPFGSMSASVYTVSIDGELYGDSYTATIEGIKIFPLFISAMIVDADGKTYALRDFRYADNNFTFSSSYKGTLVIYNNYLIIGAILVLAILIILIAVIARHRDKRKYYKAQQIADAAKDYADYYRDITKDY